MTDLRKTQGSAPGRIDVLGGVADYSGSLVLETPVCGQTTVDLRELPADQAELRFTFSDPVLEYALPLAEFTLAAGDGLEAVRAFLRHIGAPGPVYYVAGCLAVLVEARGVAIKRGLEFSVSSTVPQSMGVSSSAALEVATLRALAAYFNVAFEGTELARLAQRAENLVVGAPCGLMDQLSSAYGQRGALLPILCRPDELQEPVALPEGVIVVGWPSGVKHSVSGAGYGTARAATFMGKQMFEALAGRTWDYAAEIEYPHFASQEQKLPETISGAEFLAEFGELADPLSSISPDVQYPVRNGLRFPIMENLNCQIAVTMLRGITPDTRVSRLQHIGGLMYESHAGYSSIGLGTDETDAMVNAVRELGPESGFYGARVSGGGCGGTVVVLLEERALPELERLRQTHVFAEDGVPLPLIR